MKSLFKAVVFLFSFSLITGFLSLPQKAEAYSPIIAVCSNGVLGDLSMDVSHNDVQQLFEVRLNHYVLDAVAVRLAARTQTTQTTISVIKRDQGVISSGTYDVTTDESWVYVDLPNVEIPFGVYLLQVEASPASTVIWKYTSNGDCINDSHLILNGNMNLNIDMGFAIYAYDGTQSDPDTAVPSGSSDQLVGDSNTVSNTSTSPSDSSSTNDQSSSLDSNSSSENPTSSDIVSKLGLKRNSSRSILETIIPVLLILFVIAAPIIFIIWMVVINRKKKEQQQETENKEGDGNTSKK